MLKNQHQTLQQPADRADFSDIMISNGQAILSNGGVNGNVKTSRNGGPSPNRTPIIGNIRKPTIVGGGGHDSNGSVASNSNIGGGNTGDARDSEGARDYLL